MPRVEFTSENKVATTNYDYPKLKLKKDERARILLLEAPVREYVHTLRKPQIINGEPQMFTDTRKDGTKFQNYKMDFLSRPICLGDATILEDKGSDPKNCPMCKLAHTNPDFTGAPQRRYAMHVIRYRTKGGSNDLVTPYSVETLVWSFTDKTFNKIADFREEWDDLRKHDLLLGPCVNELYQQFDITVSSKAAWLEDSERKTLTARTFKENQIPDLTIACGSVKEKRWIEEDLAGITEAWTAVNGHTASSHESTDLDADLNDLMDGADEKWADGKTEAEAKAETKKPKKSSKKAATVVEDETDVDDLLGDLDDGPSLEVTPEDDDEGDDKEPVPAGGVDNFDDLLGDLA